MNGDFHYYATYCASLLAGYSHEEACQICYSANFVDHCTRIFLKMVGGPSSAATTQTTGELADARTDLVGLQDITRIWSSFHFLPRDLHADPGRGTKRYKNKYRLICGPNGELLKETVKRAKGKGPEAAGLAMHVLADTWAHMYFAGTPSMVINSTDSSIRELIETENGETERHIAFVHNPALKDNPETGRYISSIFRFYENNVMSLGHGRCGHLPDYSYIRYVYMPSWGNYKEILKDNPSDYYHAFTQMVYALKYLNGEEEEFLTDTYDEVSAAPYAERIRQIIAVRRTDASADWKALGESISGREIPAFDLTAFVEEYESAPENRKDRETYLGRFFLAAMAQKSLVTSRIYASGNILAGQTIDYKKNGFRGIKDYRRLIPEEKEVKRK